MLDFTFSAFKIASFHASVVWLESEPEFETLPDSHTPSVLPETVKEKRKTHLKQADEGCITHNLPLLPKSQSSVLYFITKKHLQPIIPLDLALKEAGAMKPSACVEEL